MVQAKGQGAFDTSKMVTMANSSVSVTYSGAGEVNVGELDWCPFNYSSVDQF